MKKEQLYISTIAPEAAAFARQYGLGLEIAEYCTAYNLDLRFAKTDAIVREKLAGIPNRILHAPFNELFPCAIDPKARALAEQRYRQAISLAKQYGAKKVVIHGGYNPWIYYPVWYVKQSIVFWKDFLKKDPGVEIVLENVLEETPDMLAEILEGVNHPNLGICLDVGHGNAYSKTPVLTWVEQLAPHIRHFHIHNNDGSWDTHSPLDQGSIPMETLLRRAEERCPDATFTLEVTEEEPSLRWLKEKRFL